MLYDILPPTVFFLSLGGIMVLVARAVVRVRRADFAADVKSYGGGGAATAGSAGDHGDVARVFRPTQRSVQVVTSRLGVLLQALQRTGAAMMALPSTIRSWRQERRDDAQARRATATADVPEDRADVPAGQQRVVQQPGPSFVDRLRDVAQETGERSGGRLAAVRERMQAVRAKRHERKAAAKSEAAALTPAPVASEPIADKQAHGVKLTRRVVAPMGMEATKPTEVPAVEPAKKPGLLARSPKLSALEQAQAALEAGKYQAAEDILVSYIVKHTKDTEAYMLLGRAALGREAWDEAMEIFEQVRRWNARQRGVNALLGHAAYRAGRYGKALECLQRAHEVEPTNRVILDELMGIAQKLDNPALQHSIEEKLTDLATEKTVSADRVPTR